MAIISSKRVFKHLQSFTRLVKHLLDVDCFEGANKVADKVNYHLINFAQDIGKLTHEEIETYMKMVMDLESNSSTANPERIISIPYLLKYLSEEQLGRLIIGFCSLKDSSLPCDSAVLQNVCQAFLVQGDLFNISDHKTVIEVFENFILLGNGSSIVTMVEKFCSTLNLTDQGFWTLSMKLTLLKDLIGSSIIWRALSDTLKDLVLTTSYEVMKNWMTQTTLTETGLSDSGIIANDYPYRQQMEKSQAIDDLLNIEMKCCIKVFTFFEKEFPSTDGQQNQTMLALFSQLFSKMSVHRLHSLMKTIYSVEVKSNLKQFPLLVELCKTLGRIFVNLPQLSAELKSSTVEFVVDVFKYLFWLEVNQVLFAQKIIAAYPLQQDSQLISQIIKSPELRMLVSSGSHENTEAFLLFLDSRILILNARIHNPVTTSLTWEQPYAVFPPCPVVESFLRSSRETCKYAKNFISINAARRFSQQLRNGQKTGKYRITVQEQGSGRGALCLITKTKEGSELTAIISATIKKELAYLNRLRLSIRKQKAGNEPDAGTLQQSTNGKVMGNQDSFLPDAKRARIHMI